MTRTTVTRIPHPLGTRSREEAARHERYANEQAWRKHSISEIQDRHHLHKDKAIQVLNYIAEKHPQKRGGCGWEELGGRVRPLRNRVFARRRPPLEWSRARDAGLVIPELLDTHSGQQTGALFDVLAVGEGVTSVRVGDVVVALAYIGVPMGDTLGDEIVELTTDVPYIDTREFEIETRRNPDGTRTQWERRMSDTERSSGGHILAVVEE